MGEWGLYFGDSIGGEGRWTPPEVPAQAPRLGGRSRETRAPEVWELDSAPRKGGRWPGWVQECGKSVD